MGVEQYNLAENVDTLFAAVAAGSDPLVGGDKLSKFIRNYQDFRYGLWVKLAGSTPNLLISIEGATRDPLVAGNVCQVEGAGALLTVTDVVAHLIPLPEFMPPLWRLRVTAGPGNGVDVVLDADLVVYARGLRS